MSDNNLEFDPTQPFDVIEETPVEFNPNEPFDVVPEETPAAPSVEPEESPEEILNQSMYVASKKNPDISAKAIKLAQKYNVSPQFAEDNLSIFEEKEQEDKIQPAKVFAATPALGRFLTNPDNAAVAKDDIEVLSKVEESKKNQSFAANLVDSVKSGFFSTLSGLAKAPALTYSNAPGPDWLYEGSYGAIARAEAAKEAGPVPESLYKNSVTKYLDEKAAKFAPEQMSMGIIESAKEGKYEDAGKSFAYQIASNMPNLVLLAVSRGAGLPVMFAGSAGGKFAENIEAGVSLDVARTGAIAAGGLEAGIEAIGGVGSAGFKESIKQITRGLGKEGAKEVFARSLKEIAKSAGTEGAEEFVTSASQDMVDYGLGINEQALDGIVTRAANAFIVGAGSGGVISGSAISVDAGYRLFQNKSEAVAAQDAYKAIGQSAKESKLNGRLPEKFKEFMDGVTDGTSIQDVFIPVQAFETYYQSKNISPVQAAQDLGIKDKYEAAKEAGADISIPMSEWTSKTINTEHYEGLANDIKFNPEGFTANEIKAEEQQLRADISLQSEAAQKEQAGVTGGTGIDYEKSARLVRQDVERQLKEVGMDSKQAKANAALYEARYRVIGEQFGFDPFEAYKANNLTIGIGSQVPTEGEVLNQLGPVTPRGVRIQPSKVGNKLSLNPLEGVESSGSLIQAPGRGTIFNIEKIKTIEDQLNLGADMLLSLEEGAARNGATVAIADLKKLKIDKSSPMADIFKSAGYTLDQDGKAFSKVLEAPRIFNQERVMAPPLVSKLVSTIEQKMGGSQDVKSLRAMLKEIKPEELKWSGFDEFVKGKDKVSKAELLDYLRANQLQIVDVTKGGEQPQLTMEDFNSNYEVQDMEVEGLEAEHNFIVPDAFKDVIEYATIEEYSDGKYELNINGNGRGSFDRMEKAIVAIEEFISGETGTRFADKVGQIDTTQYSKYTLPGGENYREVLFTLPESAPKITKLPPGFKIISEEKEVMQFSFSDEKQTPAIKKYFYVIDSDGKKVDTAPMLDGASAVRLALRKLNDQRLEMGQDFTSSHFDEKNILAHVRLNDRTDADGKKVLFVEEIQSDWHQAGRKKGYRGELPDVKSEIQKLETEMKSLVDKYSPMKLDNPERKPLVEKYKELQKQKGELENQDYKSSYAVPDAPFKKTWHEFAFKRILRMAAEGGYEKVAWTTGEQQAERFDLSKQVDYVTAVKNSDGTFDADAYKDGEVLTGKANIKPEDLDELFGKDLAEKIRKESGKADKQGVRKYEAEDLKVGGEGMKGFYDKILVDFANKFGKKFGAKVGDVRVSAGQKEASSERAKIEKGLSDLGDLTFEDFKLNKERSDEDRAIYDTGTKSLLPRIIVDDRGASLQTETQARIQAKNLEELRQKVFGKPEDLTNYEQVHSLDITPQLKDAALYEGFTLFQGGDDIRGQIRFGVDSVNIDLLKNADASTFIHETGHFFVEQMHDLAQMPQAPEQFKKDYETLWKYLGATPGEKLTVEQHEKAADAYETYFMEGKAPSNELRAVFAKLRAWILQAYKMLVQQKVELTDDVRQVFDRMLIGDAALQQAESDMNLDKPLISDPKQLGMSNAEFERYQKALSEAKESAREQITSKLMADHKKTKTKEYEAKRDSVAAQVERELNDLPVYKAIAALQKYKTPYGTPLPASISANFGSANFKLDEDWLTAKYGKGFKKELSFPKGIVSKNGLAPQEVADLFGFASGEDLINAIMIAEDKNKRAERETNARMELQNPDTITSNELPEEVLSALHNEERSKVLRLELKAMVESNLPAFKAIVRKIARRVPTEKAAREQAANTIAKLSTKDIRPVVYKRAEVKYAKEAGQLLAKGDIEGAFEAKRKELLNFELYRAAVEARDDVKKTLKDLKKKLVKSEEDISKTRDTDMVNAARALLAEYGIMRADKTADEYLENIKRYDPDTYNGIEVLIAPTIQGAGNYQAVSYDQFVVMKDAVNALWDLAKTSKEIEIDGKRMNKDQLKADLIAHHDDLDMAAGKKNLYQQTMDKWGRLKSSILGARASLIRAEHWADAMDIEFGGPHRKYIWNPISKAAQEYRVKKAEVIKKLEEILKSNEKSFTKEPIIAEEFKSDAFPGGFKFQNKSELLMSILHSGNDSNLQKLLVGRGWGSINELGQLDRSKWDQFFERMISEKIVTKADMDMVQQIWDLNESLKPDSQKAHKQMYGYYFKEITANPIQTPFGEYRGGYMPAKVDINENEDAAIRNEKEEFENNNKSFMFPTTGRGFTKSRVEQYAAPLSLDLRLISTHIDASLRFTYIEPRVKEVSRLIVDKEFRKSLARIDSAIAKDMLIPWLQRAAQQKVVLPSDDGLGRAMDSAARFFRRNVSAQIMFGNVTNTLQQYTGLVVAMSLVKPRHIRNAMVDYIKSPSLSVDEITEKSKFMFNNQKANIYEISKSVNDIIINPSVFEKIQDFTAKHTYFLQTAVQNQVNSIVWMGGYNQAIEEGMTESDAISFADAAVRKTQGSASAEDISRFETGTPTQLLFKQFVGYFNMLANLNAGELIRIQREVGLKKGAGKAFYLYLTGFMIPAVLSSVIVQIMSGKGLDQNDDDEYLDDALKTFFESQFLTLTATLPYGGQFAASVYNRFNDKMYDDRLSLSPVISTLEGVAGLPKELYKNLADDADNNKKLTGDFLTFLGTFTGIPSAPLRKPINYLTDVSTGEAEPTGPIDFTRGLVTGKTGNEGQ